MAGNKRTGQSPELYCPAHTLSMGPHPCLVFPAHDIHDSDEIPQLAFDSGTFSHNVLEYSIDTIDSTRTEDVPWQ